jgi:hypothetical protein
MFSGVLIPDRQPCKADILWQRAQYKAIERLITFRPELARHWLAEAQNRFTGVPISVPLSDGVIHFIFLSA